MKQNISIIHTPTKEEKAIVSMLANGEKGNHVAEKIGVTESVLASKLATIRYRYKVRNSTELVAKFIRAGVI